MRISLRKLLGYGLLGLMLAAPAVFAQGPRGGKHGAGKKGGKRGGKRSPIKGGGAGTA